MKIVKLKISDLKLDPENVRHHGAENIEMIKRSLQENKQYKPIVVDSNTMVVRIGNGRLQAMKSLGWTECWCVLLDFNGHEGLEVLDNRLNELSYWTDSSLDDWLLNDKGLDWWGVDSRKARSLQNKKRASEKKEESNDTKKESVPRCPCCGKPLHKVTPTIL